MGERILGALALATLVASCGGNAAGTVRVDPVPAAQSPESLPRDSDGGASFPPGPGGLVRPRADLVLSNAEETLLQANTVFQPGFHQALRWSFTAPGKVTLRFKVPVTRAGGRIRIAFAAGDDAMVLHRATVARAGSGGALASAAVPLRFAGADGAKLGARERVVSDPLRFPVGRMEELYVSLVVEGALATSAIDAFPESFIAWGDQAFGTTLHDEAERRRLTGLTTIEVEAERSLALVAFGDSITEGYVSGWDDTRNAWPMLLAKSTGLPVANTAVSGQGLWAAHEYFQRDAAVLGHVTDCLVLLGTNDLGAKTAEQLEANLEKLFVDLRGMCRIWAGTLLPKEKTSAGDLASVNQVRNELNEWIRHDAQVDGVIDFERAVADPENPDRFIQGYSQDGIHPSLAGQAALGEFAAKFVADTLAAQH